MVSKNQRINSDNPPYLELYFDRYEPEESRGVVVQIATGMVEHKEHYKWVANELCARGYVVFVADHRGHGLSVLEDKSEIYWGEMGENGFEWAVKDMVKLARHIKTLYPTHKLVLLGHSMGSLLARRWVQHNYYPLDALILTGTPSPFWGLRFCAFLLKTLGRFNVRLKAGVNTLFSLHPKIRRYQGNWVCKNTAALKLLRIDPASRFLFSTKSFALLVEGAFMVFHTHAYGRKDLPILFLSGLDDVCGGFGVGVVKAHHCLEKQGFKDIELRLFSKDRHKILDETDKQVVLESLLKWLESKGL
ncbi:alpha/beta fold hydrolase [Helicobacter ailurogastricus]|uniref:Lysophospholipase Monoglyceride lipase putative n=1 Tax=Helicobacter ailurogastricus TaxID=1578720 RepID=A0A0K2XGY7_9HELI|nr:alpha/beta hydrolase [Helicobacter ailurogastricus]CRF40506.1 Lysophospholipase; Monoglyceride lipase; putative [Helicobacter ailurogastricus]CRF42797.1 Lysophospholipase; Monoglyceride lipase; putative [Helicobacter ailurogastricus]CRF44853.1 Lysophospholipase; Monoglyceride lipase; putative [Helicobacter ailurogastricus]GLH58254.1 alpha/beta hydrolase [Helicobacter ailurogastricus]GLH59126.1 alpha/beta hydrolase [Helicobacter ailurogastricus]